MAWRLAYALETLRAEINAAWPGRDKASDGTIGDAAHASRGSDHNPWVIGPDGKGVVRAIDVDKDGVPAADLVERIRIMGAAGDPRLVPNGYVIFNRRITSPDFRRWNAYNGSNPHDKHFHVSFSTNAAGYDSRASWGIARTGGGGSTPPAPAPRKREIEVSNLQFVNHKGAGEFHGRADVSTWDDLSEAYVSISASFGRAARFIFYIVGKDGVARSWGATGRRVNNNGPWESEPADSTRTLNYSGGLNQDSMFRFGLPRDCQGVIVQGLAEQGGSETPVNVTVSLTEVGALR